MANLNFKSFEKFFGTEGMTMTSANYIANKAKELVKSLKNSFNFLTTEVEVVGTDKTACVPGMNKEAFERFKDNVSKVCQLNGLISWLREAIKAKEAQIEEIESVSFSSWMRIMHPEVNTVNYGAEIEEIEEPDRPDCSIEGYIRKNFSVKDAADYFNMLAACATIGKIIHPDGSFNTARSQAYEIDGSSSIFNRDGVVLIETKILSLPKEEIDSYFFSLQEKYREYQKLTNKIRFDVERAIQEMEDEYSRKMETYQRKRAHNEVLVDAKRQVYREEYNNWKISTLKETRDKKIVLPKSLIEITNFVNSL